MIIKTKICAGGGRSLTRFPLPRFRMEECLKDGGKRLDLSRAMLAFTGDPSLFQVSDHDDERVLWAAMTFCELMQDSFTRCVEDESCDLNDHAVTAQDEKIEERMERRHVWIRQSISPWAEGVTVKIAVNNPFEVIGQSEEQAHEIAVNYVQMWLRIMQQTKAMKIRIETDALHLERARAANYRADLRRILECCEKRHGGMCSPIDTGCPCYKDGRCRYEEMTK